MDILEFRELQEKTLASFKTISEDFYAIDYQHPYCLDAILAKGARNTADLVIKVAKQQYIPKNLMGMKAEEFACSSFDCKNENNQHVMGRNFDFKRAQGVAVWCHPKDGYSSLAFSDANFMLYGYKVRSLYHREKPFNMLLAPFTCVDGINEKGLAISVLEIKAKPTRQSRGKRPVTTSLAVRGVLDTCATVDEAIKFFSSHDMRDSIGCNYHFHVIDREGSSVIIEYVNNDMRILFPEGGTDDGFAYQCLTNFFLSWDGDNKRAFGHGRYKKMSEKLAQKQGQLNGRECMELLQEVSTNTRHKIFRWRVTTLWSAVYNTETCEVELCTGLDYTKKYKLAVDKPGVIEDCYINQEVRNESL